MLNSHGIRQTIDGKSDILLLEDKGTVKLVEVGRKYK